MIDQEYFVTIKLDFKKVNKMKKKIRLQFIEGDLHKCKHCVVYTRDHPIFFVIMSYFDKWST